MHSGGRHNRPERTVETTVAKVPSPDLSGTRFVTASVEEVQHAQELRRQIQQRYLDRGDVHDPYWSVGAD
jgi:hypothetical protein